jgi:hypothetical protein
MTPASDDPTPPTDPAPDPARPEPWLAAHLRGVLAPVARRGGTITYRDLAVAAQVPGPHTIHKTTLALEELIRADHAAGAPLLAAVAVGKTGRPRPGFFHVLAELGRYDGPERGPEAEARHDVELAAVYAAFQT